jgi:hypothetical protein
VQVFARGASSPALQVGYTSLSFARPAASNFSFTPPPGAQVKTITSPALGGFPPGVPLPGLPAGGNGSVVLRVQDGKAVPARLMPSIAFRPAWALNGIVGCVAPPGTPAAVPKQIIAQLPKAVPQAQRAALQKKLAAGATGGCTAIHVIQAGGGPGISPSSVPVPPGVMAAAVPRVLGHDWLSVLVLPAAGPSASGLPACLPQRTVVYSNSSTSSSTVSSSSGTVTFSSGAVSGSPGVDVSGLGGALLSAARPVHGSWGSGRLLRTSLLSVLITDSGQVLIGAVQPSVLYADAAQLR